MAKPTFKELEDSIYDTQNEVINYARETPYYPVILALCSLFVMLAKTILYTMWKEER